MVHFLRILRLISWSLPDDEGGITCNMYVYHISTLSDLLCHGVDSGSVVRASDFYTGDLGSDPIRDMGFFQTMYHVLFTNFHIRKMGARRKWTK